MNKELDVLKTVVMAKISEIQKDKADNIGVNFLSSECYLHCDGKLEAFQYVLDEINKIMKERNIEKFEGEYYFLSNFYYSDVAMDGRVYPTVEHAFQAAKTLVETERETIRNVETPKEAKRLGRKVLLRKDWEDVKIDIMKKLLIDKFSPGRELAEKLKNTGDRKLIEGNYWGNTFWGVCYGVGSNHLGNLLMEVRSELNKG